MQQRLAPYLFVSPFLLLFAVFGLYPIIKSLQLATYATNGPKDLVFIGLGNFKFLLADPDFHTAVKNTATYAVFSVLLQLPLALGLALLLTQPWVRGREWFRLAFFSPKPARPGVRRRALFRAVHPQYGLLNKGLNWLTYGRVALDTKWLSEPSLVMPAIVMTSGVDVLRLQHDLFSGRATGLWTKSCTRRRRWMARTSGSSSRPSRSRASSRSRTFVLVTATIGSFQLFELPYTMLNSSAGPNNAGLTVVMYLYNNGFVTGDLGYASAVGWTLALGVLLISLIQMRLTGSFKGAND
jgi:ABC-type sugar transport system permease subunit